MNVCILDYGSGNVKSVYNLIKTFTKNVVISNNNSDLTEATHLILPGVGAFGASMQKIKKKIDLNKLNELVFEYKKPFLGICVGMQVLADVGYEFGEHEGLGWIHGKVVHLESRKLPLPHIGWNNVKVNKNDCKLMSGINNDFDFYFVHSYVFDVLENDRAVSYTEYGSDFVSVINQDNIYGVQFHPEKSQIAGKKIIHNFLNFC
jgi:glutamine amidotransferase